MFGISKTVLLIIGIFTFLMLGTVYKSNHLPSYSTAEISGDSLARRYCQSCHLFPDPNLLNKSKWKVVLPQMALRMDAKNLVGAKDWQKILDYYHDRSPVTLPAQQRSMPIHKDLDFFSVTAPPKTFFRSQLLATYVKIDTTVSPARIFVADGWENKLFLFSRTMKFLDSISTPGPVTDMNFSNDQILVCMIGKDLKANDEKNGSITGLSINKDGKMVLTKKPLFDSLARPVGILATDLNADGKTDYLICEFGNINGNLSWMENKGFDRYEKHNLSSTPGAIKIYVDSSIKKLDSSGSPDIWVLFAQGKERICHFINKGVGIFEEHIVLEFPPSFGSSSFELVDINGDGYKDIVYTCGDNGDATAILKPYHGLYVFLNDGHDNFKQNYFYPVNGCYKAIARDYDGDGNIDIATVSVYTDSRQPEEGFVYFKNRGGLQFKPYALPSTIKFERGVTLDAGDLGHDGKTDLLIGNAFFDFGPFAKQKNEPIFYLLNNKMK